MVVCNQRRSAQSRHRYIPTLLHDTILSRYVLYNFLSKLKMVTLEHYSAVGVSGPGDVYIYVK